MKSKPEPAVAPAMRAFASEASQTQLPPVTLSHTAERITPTHAERPVGPPPLVLSVAQAMERARLLAQRPGRTLLGLVGAPGSGKSTFAQRLCAHVGGTAQGVPMDGFHLAQVELERLGRAARKGAPDTFDAGGYVALLQRLRQQAQDEWVYAPEFRRDLEEPIAGAIALDPARSLLITEGNYLLLPIGDWGRVRGLLDEVWFLSLPPALRRQRLCERHVRYGRTMEQALAWVEATDEPNARLVEAHQGLAHYHVEFSSDETIIAP